jgi:ferredoxin
MNRIFSRQFFCGVFIAAVVFAVSCIDTVKKNPVSLGSKVVCRIEASKCNGCGLCVKACALNAIVETQLNGEWVCFITPGKCNGCGECISACEDDAIVRIEVTDGD